MAAKSSMAFDSQQVQDLASAVKALTSNLQTTMDSAEVVFKELEGEEIIGESTQKAPITDAIKVTRDAYVSVADKLSRINNTIDSVCQELSIAIKQNIKSNEEAVAALSSAAKRAKEATGANA